MLFLLAFGVLPSLTLYIVGLSRAALFSVLIENAPIIQDFQVLFPTTRFTVHTPELIRIEYLPTGEFVDDSSLFAVARCNRDRSADIQFDNSTLTIQTSRMKLAYIADGAPLSAANLQIETKTSEGQLVIWTPGMPSLRNLGGTLESLDRVTGLVNVGEGRA